MKSFNDFIKEAVLSAKQKKIAAIAGDKDKIDADDLAALRAGKKPVEEAKKCMDEDDMDESGLRMAAHAAHKEGKKEFEFQGKTYPVKVQKEEVEQIDELSKDTLRSYVGKAEDDVIQKHKAISKVPGSSPTLKHDRKMDMYKRMGNITKAYKKITKEETEELDEGRMKDLAYDLDNMSHDEFHKHYGKPKSHYDPTNFKKPVQKGHEMDRAKELAQRGLKSVLSKEEVERIEELSKKTLGSYVKKASGDLASSIHYERDAEEDDDSDAAGAYAHRAGKRMDGLQRAGKKIAKEEVEQIDELSKDTLRSYKDKAKDELGHYARNVGNPAVSSTQKEKSFNSAVKRIKGVQTASDKLKEDAEQIDELSKKTLGSYVKKASHDARMMGQIAGDFENRADKARLQSRKDSNERLSRKYLEKAWKRDTGIGKAVDKLTKEEVAQEMSPYVKGTLDVLESKIDDLRDAQKLRAATKSAYDKDYKDTKPDTSHPAITVNKGTAYGGAAQKDDEGDEKKDNENQEKRGRGRPAGKVGKYKSRLAPKSTGDDWEDREFKLHLPK